MTGNAVPSFPAEAAPAGGPARPGRPERAEPETHPRNGYPVGSGRLLLRCLGVMLWRAADPSTLPVRPAGFTAPATPRRTAAATVAVAIWVAALAVAAGGIAAERHFRHASTEFLRNPQGLSLASTADRMEKAAAAPWGFLSPPAARRLLRLAASVRQGERSLADAARAYDAAAARMRGLSPVARAEAAPNLLDPVRATLGETRSTWHRETITYRELQRALAAATARGAPADGRLQGRLSAVTPEHALQLCVLDPGGRPLEAPTRALHPGDSFDLPLPPEGSLLLTDLVRKGQGLLEVGEEMRLPLREWTEQPIRFPGGGATVQMRFSGVGGSAAAAFPPLSPAARVELGWPGEE